MIYELWKLWESEVVSLGFSQFQAEKVKCPKGRGEIRDLLDHLKCESYCLNAGDLFREG